METIRHHLNDSLLMAYSAGTLPESFSVVVASHVSVCDECRARLGAFDALGGATLTLCNTAEMRAGSLAETLARVRGERQREPFAAARERAGPRVLPTPLRDYVGGDVDAIAWRRIGGGVRQRVLKTAGAGSVRLLFIPPGLAVHDHGHAGTEVTMVLKGAYRDETDRFGPGDVEIADEDLHHQPVAEPGEPCICLAASDAPLRFRGLIPRLLGPVIGI